MELVVDLTDATVSVWLPDDFERLSVRVLTGVPATGDAGPTAGDAGPGEDAGMPVEGALGALAAALSVHDLGTVDPTGEVHLEPASLRSLAGGSDPDGAWVAGFDAMVAGAVEHGWVDEDGCLRAHVDWSG
jgi:hypothetical protein